jgi:hypothetical protein
MGFRSVLDTLGESMLISPRKLKEFKEQLGFDQLVVDPNPDVGVAADWDGIQEYLPTREAGWEPFSEDVSVLPGGPVTRKWSFRRGKATFILRIHVFSTGTAAALDHLLSQAALSTLSTIPYVRGPSWLGQLSIQVPGTPLQRVFWVFHNVHVELRDTSEISVEPIVRSIQDFMERHVSQHVSHHLPHIDKVTVSKHQLQVDEEVEVQVHPKQTPAAKQLSVHLRTRPEEFRLTKQSETSSTYRALLPGKTTIEVSLSDSKWLLMSQAQVQVDVQPKE